MFPRRSFVAFCRVNPVAIAVLLLAAAIEPAGAGVGPVTSCAISKERAIGHAVQQILACHAKAAKSGDIVDQDCLSKTSEALGNAFGKADAKVAKKSASCPSVVLATDVQMLIDAAVQSIEDALRPMPQASKGTAKKLSATGKYAAGFFGAYGKVPDADKVTAMQADAVERLLKAFAKIDDTGSAQTSGDGTTAGALVRGLGQAYSGDEGACLFTCDKAPVPPTTTCYGRQQRVPPSENGPTYCPSLPPLPGCPNGTWEYVADPGTANVFCCVTGQECVTDIGNECEEHFGQCIAGECRATPKGNGVSCARDGDTKPCTIGKCNGSKECMPQQDPLKAAGCDHNGNCLFGATEYDYDTCECKDASPPTECPSGTYCGLGGVCVDPCASNPCPQGQTCYPYGASAVCAETACCVMNVYYSAGLCGDTTCSCPWQLGSGMSQCSAAYDGGGCTGAIHSYPAAFTGYGCEASVGPAGTPKFSQGECQQFSQCSVYP